MVSDALVQEIRERADILEITGEFVQLKRSGKTYRGPCPLHGGEGPNFSVDPARGIFKCFVCGEGGDVFSFLMKHLGLDFPSAVRQVAARVGVEIPEDSEPREDPHAHLREAVAFADEWFRAMLLDPSAGRPAREYLSARGVEPDLAEDWGLGFAPDAWRQLRDAGLARGLTDENLLEAGLLATSEKADAPYDRFRNRVMFAIQDLRDRPIAFGGRVLGTTDEQAPKYINSPETPIFHKSRTLYGLNRARHAIRREEHSLVTEGFMDALSLHIGGFPTAVAPLGTALTAEQADLLKRYANRVYLLYDSDAAGLRATFRAGDVLLAAGCHPMVVSFPPGEDPDSVLRREGADALRGYISDAVDILERKLQILERQGYLDSIEGKRRAVDGLLSTLRSVRDPALLDIYLGRAAERTGVRRDTLVGEVARERQVPRGRPSAGAGGRSTTGAVEDERRTMDPAERALLLLVARDRALLEVAVEGGLEDRHFRDAALRRIYQALLIAGDERPGLSPEDDLAWQELLEDDTEVVHPRDAFDETVRRIVHRAKLDRLAQIDRELDLAEEDQARRLLVEKEEVARELRGAGVSLSFLRRYSDRVRT
ncbi:MAG: DNA primase [Candidatus Palauibacterales bacterium]|nr:DNA primase [Candidatus Palauibacterales bacterium]MDP2483284.1 DNA primase [Candidatus Palauibacterales bacterium]